jgi:tetratricopeptide (TPR) repeat protein
MENEAPANMDGASTNPERDRSMSDLHDRYNGVEKLIDAENYEEAIVGLSGIVDDDSGFVLAHLALARVYTKTGQHDLAIQHAEKACEVEPSDSFNFTALSVTYQRAWAGTEDQQYIAKAEEAMAKAQAMS